MPGKNIDKDLPRQIDEADQFSPDSWIPRSYKLTRLTGKHPLNAEVNLTTLFDGGLITPSPIHYVRNHGSVPHLLWENHKLEIIAGKCLLLGMDELKNQFESINTPIFLACDGNRRKELNMMKKTRVFNYTAAAAGCSYWKGVLPRDVLLAADIQQLAKSNPNKSFWVNHKGADDLSEGKYETCLPLDYALNSNNDWLSKIWLTDYESDSYYYIYDNRQLPSFIDDPESEIAQIMYRHPSTIRTTQMLNSVIVRPAQGERIDLAGLRKGAMYRVEGYAYSGSGNEVDRVEVSLDGGFRWLYCVRKYPDAPIRRGRKFWTWLHWHIDLPVSRFIRAESILVRAFDEHKNTQPPKPVWNIEGMMNNCWYEVRPETHDSSDTSTSLLFRHPVDTGTSTNGWMKPSTSEQIESIKQKASAPEKQFTRQEIEKHNTEDDCWIVVNGNVYDATSVLGWHPGGKGAILAHAGAVNMDTTEDFESIHDNYAQDNLKECIIGKVTQKAMDHMKKDAEQKKAEKSQTEKKDPEVALDKHNASHPTPNYKPSPFHPPPKNSASQQANTSNSASTLKTVSSPILETEDDGSFDLVVKTYFPDENQPGGTMSNILDCLREGEEVEVKGPSGEIRYLGNRRFEVDGDEHTFSNVTLILGGSGVTPGYQIIARILKTTDDKTKNQSH
ncbi:uncharacterized protein ASPGLDRAFT_33866 [Aspergillus glaucus CBS 516.65]|uniref:Nitrate reductase [NADPH] n=1 Tax=Aspergillus glaucus CBS 516.65 TaxID=1160497 RepID=A0A1L9VPY7_ASPGL|nr:hypothetical protein ASPGLDRAFT_33866 [Aspergillus glaucus CBS 516.65]OJJ85950.1 hypothetical protein ASPGLDRAFT_33866 [Aspergillus glaucus CBS 516.65]